MSVLTLKESFATSAGAIVTPTSVVLSDPTGVYGVKRNDTDAVVVVDATPMVYVVADENWQYSFVQPADGLTYTYWVEWVYGGETFRDEHTVIGTVPDGLTSVRNTDKYLDWIKAEFQPLTLATPDATLKQCVENAIRYWNTHSAYKIGAMVAYPSGSKRVEIPKDFKQVTQVSPSRATSWIWNDHPLWTITGVQILDNVTSDLIMMTEAFRNYQIYVGSDFRWTFIKSEDPDTTGGYLYAVNVPKLSQSLFVNGTKRVTATEDIKQQNILDWILSYALALTKMIEGNTLRKASIVDIKNDGNDLVREGKEEKIALQERLARDARWVVMARRV